MPVYRRDPKVALGFLEERKTGVRLWEGRDSACPAARPARYFRAATLREGRHHRKVHGDSATSCAPQERSAAARAGPPNEAGQDDASALTLGEAVKIGVVIRARVWEGILGGQTVSEFAEEPGKKPEADVSRDPGAMKGLSRGAGR